jgi:hypothetical protein
VFCFCCLSCGSENAGPEEDLADGKILEVPPAETAGDAADLPVEHRPETDGGPDLGLDEVEAGDLGTLEITDVPPAEVGEALELPEVEVPPSYPFGKSCQADADCPETTGACLNTPLGGLCTADCGLGCPPGWECWTVELETLCVPPAILYCEPCDPAVAPPFDDLKCSEVGGTWHTLMACDADEECGLGLECVEAGESYLCLPSSKRCDCLPPDQGQQLPCQLENEHGLCPGLAECLGDKGLGTCLGTVPKAEMCNGADDDCDGAWDEESPNCTPGSCSQDGVACTMKGPEKCVEGTCQATETVSCGLYVCDKFGPFGVCLTGCAKDAGCVPGAYCGKDGTCKPKQADGGLCAADGGCQSGHCNHSICCQLGDCCFEPDFCPASYSLPPVCDDPTVCQGHRQEPLCANFMCQEGPAVPDDSGCDETVVAQECGAFPSATCNGLEKQVVPPCAKTCQLDGNCQPGSHCDSVCIPDLADGLSCNEDTDCASHHCNSGMCCGGGTCCDEDSDCHEGFASPAACMDKATCQGQRVDAVCTDNVCHSTPAIDDDTACTADVVALTCGTLADLHCSGEESQLPPGCAEQCLTDGSCDPFHTCQDGACVAQVQDGAACESDALCLSGHCANGLCCVAGDCCNQPADCPDDYRQLPACTQSGACQGLRIDATCEEHACGSLGPLDDDSACGPDVVAKTCVPYPDLACSGEPAQVEPQCASACKDDSACAATAHCDGTCKPDLADGYSCDEDSDCLSGHCSNGFCCPAGDCCAEPKDCPPIYSLPPTCEMPEACQGIRIDALCVSFQCQSTDTLGDDSGCDASIIAVECGDYAPLTCNGKKYQSAPNCPGGCTADSECLPAFHCDGSCEPDLPAGEPCDEDTDCTTGHCANGFCCQAGICCSAPADCLMQFSSPPVCVSPQECQGSRKEPTCQENMCGSATVEDDSACTAKIVIDGCGFYLDATCSGQAVQLKPKCPVACSADSACEAGAHCDGACLPDRPNGSPCDEGSDCLSGHCSNAFCCPSGVCCALAGDCPESFWNAPACDSKSTCQGHRKDGSCNGNVCQSVTVEDDSACDATVLVHDCGPNPDLYCGGGEAQVPPICSASCKKDEECGKGYHCDSTCKIDMANGLSCDEDSDCESFHCSNGFCCTSGECCQFNTHCPDSYQSAAVCDSSSTCQGHRQDKACTNFICTSQKVGDDSACLAAMLAKDCGLYKDLYCNGQAAQPLPVCPAACKWDSQCDAAAHCDGSCVADQGAGTACDEASDCASAYCGNGFCCAQGACCQQASDCPAQFWSKSTCTSPGTCQGARKDATCKENQCGTQDVEDDSACGIATLSDVCGPYVDLFCSGEADQPPPACPDSCLEDTDCDPSAHCDDVCVKDLQDGKPCDEDGDCASGHCSDGLCCKGGDCCLLAADCPSQFWADPKCISPATCQGIRIDAVCQNFVCAPDVIDDDVACLDGLVANDCGAYPPVVCTGKSDQKAPACAQWCIDDSGCDPGAHCDGVCVGNLPDGSTCNEDSDCLSGHCSHSVCCKSGDCCLAAAACPAQYRKTAVCDAAGACQGHRVDATCLSFVCGSVDVEDDSGCGWWTVADECGFFAPVTCNGTKSQSKPACPVVCQSDTECDSNAHCDGTCVKDSANGNACDEDSDCQSAHCANGFCCTAGTCCAQTTDCPASFAIPPACTNPGSCQGFRSDKTCQSNVCASVQVQDDSACSAQTKAADCSPYLPVFCDGKANQAVPSCPNSCAGDAFCEAAAHCEAGLCTPDRANGLPCDEGTDCQSGHCANGICCGSGDCCVAPADCPAKYSAAAACLNPAACQGKRTEAVCQDHTCGSAQVEDDSACSALVEANACGPYKPVYCNGQVEQLAPKCPVTCTYDKQCDLTAHCDGQCLDDLPNGQPCDEDSDCLLAHCSNGFCCASGNCCSKPSNCPASYSAPSACVTQPDCQGSRKDATCLDSQCGSIPVADDSGCTVLMVADDCGPYPPVSCNGQKEQSKPPCPTQCASESQCDPSAHCDGGLCLADLPNGQLCTGDLDCQSQHCQNGYCCAAGDCCAFASGCPAAYKQDPVCNDVGSCQGFRYDAVCAKYSCTTLKVEDDSKCTAAVVSDNCGFFLPVHCNGAAEQNDPACPVSCENDLICDDDGHCDDGKCTVDLADGQPCDEASDCISSFCVDAFCCDSECSEPGRSCNQPGIEGQCWP